MPVVVERDLTSSNIIHLKFMGQWNWDNFNNGLIEIRQIIQNDPLQTFHIVCDLLENKNIPFNQAIFKIRKAIKNPQPNSDIVVVVTSSEAIHFIIGSVKGLVASNADVRLFSCYSLEQAHNLIMEHSSTPGDTRIPI